MTLNDAIRYADMIMAGRTPPAEYFEEQRTYAAMCADALRLAKRKEEGKDPCVPETWQERMQCEYCETKARYENLHRMVTKFEAGVLEFTPKSSLELLRQQKRHMGEYLHDLEIRGYVEGVEL